MTFKNFPIIITKKDSDGPHYAFCKAKTLDELHDLVQLLVDRVIVYKDYIEITFNLIPGINQNENMKTHVKLSREQLRSQSWKK